MHPSHKHGVLSASCSLTPFPDPVSPALIPGGEPRIREQFFHLNEPTNIPSKNNPNRMKRQGDLWAEGFEQVHYEADKGHYGENNMRNRKAPSSNNHGEVDRARDYLDHRDGQPCPRR